MKTQKVLLALVVIALALTAINQVQILQISNGSSLITETKTVRSASLSDVNIDEIKSTKHAVKLLFDAESIQSQQDAVNVIVPSGTPEYSAALGDVSFDDPTGSLGYLANIYPQWEQEVKQDSALWGRYLNLMTGEHGISCEYCCGIQASMVDETGRIVCGCQHAPALAAVTLGLLKETDYNDAEILREALRWKTLFFPKNMVQNAIDVSEQSLSDIELPGMVGGC